MKYQKIGLICAVEGEIRLLSQDISSEKSTVVAGREFFEGVLYGREVVLVQSRIGKVAAASTVTTLIDRFAVDCVIFCGTAGGVDKALNVGDFVVGDRLVQHDFFTGVDWFRIPMLDVSYFEADRQLSEQLHAAVDVYIREGLRADVPQRHLDEFGIVSPKVAVGTIASGDQFICEAEKHRWLEEHLDRLQCVEMEGAAVAQVCYEFGVPFAVLRVISDSANDDSNVDFARFVEEAACHFTRGTLKAFLTGDNA